MRLRALLDLSDGLVENDCPIDSNDAEVRRAVPAIADPFFGSRERVFGRRGAKGPPSLDYLVRRVHLNYEQRKIGGHDFMPYLALR
jgi:hypothetical protein